MEGYNGYKAEKSAARELLPAGGYAAKILDAKEQKYDWGRVLLISFDIIEGDFKDFFKADYNGQTGEDKKWRGVMRLNVPKDDGSEKDDWTKRSFGNAMWAIEDSNSGFKWDWDETKLKGKLVGVLFRNREWEMYTDQGYKTGWTTECSNLSSIEDIRNGKFKVPKDKPLSGKKASSFSEAASTGADDDLPWN